MTPAPGAAAKATGTIVKGVGVDEPDSPGTERISASVDAPASEAMVVSGRGWFCEHLTPRTLDNGTVEGAV